MIRETLSLLSVLGVCGLCSGLLVLNQSWNTGAAESARLSRVMLQHVEQNLARVKQAAQQGILPSLDTDLDSLKVQLAMQMGKPSMGTSAHSLTFSQDVLAGFAAAQPDVTINVLALNVNFVSAHAPAALKALDEIGAHIGAWPFEVRACELFRLEKPGVTVSCMVHIYHWSIADAQRPAYRSAS